MPSGAKKRKAAKKKKEMEAHINPVTNNSQGNDDLRFQNEKGSDGSEVDSPAHQDHHNHQHPFNEGNKELEERDPAATPSLVTAEKSMEEVTSIVEGAHTVGVEDDGVVNIGRDFKSDETSGIKEVNIEQVESNKESHIGDDRSSSSSSDDESLLSEKKSKEEYNSVPVAIIPDNLVKTVDSSSAKVDLITENTPVEETVNSVTNVSSVVDSIMPVVSESKVTTHVTGSVSIEKSVEAKGTPTVVIDVALKRTEDTIFCSSDENAKVSTGLVESKLNVYEGKDLTSSGTTSIQSSNGTEHVKDSGSLDFSENQPLVAHAPGAVQKTSWLSCCGLLEVVTTGSSR